jgi:hypothetical protein
MAKEDELTAFFAEHSVMDANTAHFRDLGRTLLAHLKEHQGRPNTEEDKNVVARYLATEIISLGAFAYARASGDLETLLKFVREEFARGQAMSDEPHVARATTQD